MFVWGGHTPKASFAADSKQKWLTKTRGTSSQFPEIALFVMFAFEHGRNEQGTSAHVAAACCWPSTACSLRSVGGFHACMAHLARFWRLRGVLGARVLFAPGARARRAFFVWPRPSYPSWVSCACGAGECQTGSAGCVACRPSGMPEHWEVACVSKLFLLSCQMGIWFVR